MDRCPDYLPAAIWKFYRKLDSDGLLNKADCEQISRLFAPEMALTWRSFARHITADDDWPFLFDLLYSLRLSFDPGARDGMRRARELLPEITEAAEVLANKLTLYRALCNDHALSGPDEFSDLLEWIHRTARADPGPLFEIWTVGRFGFPKPGAIELKYLPDPISMIEVLGRAAEYYEPDCRNETSTHVDDRKDSTIAAWVRHFDVRWKYYQEPGNMAARFAVSDTDLARIATAVLNPAREVTREAVARARSRAQD